MNGNGERFALRIPAEFQQLDIIPAETVQIFAEACARGKMLRLKSAGPFTVWLNGRRMEARRRRRA